MNTRGLTREERKKAKRTARKKLPPKPPRSYDRGAKKRKLRKRGPGAPKRR